MSVHGHELGDLHSHQRDDMHEIFQGFHGTAMDDEQRLRDEDNDSVTLESYPLPVNLEVQDYRHAEGERSQAQYRESGAVFGYWAEVFFLSWTFIRLLLTLPFFVNAGLGIAVLLACFYTGTSSSLSLPLFSFAIAFPISFGFSFTFKRREDALREVATMKSAALQVWQGCRDFPPSPSDFRTEQSRNVQLGSIKHARKQLLIIF